MISVLRVCLISQIDTSIDCNGPEHIQFVFVNMLLIIAYQAIPIGYILILLRVRGKLVPAEAETPEQALQMRDADQDLNPVRFLVNDLKCECWYHEVRRSAVVLLDWGP